jgi:hypothetical protein
MMLAVVSRSYICEDRIEGLYIQGRSTAVVLDETKDETRSNLVNVRRSRYIVVVRMDEYVLQVERSTGAGWMVDMY